MTDATDAQIRKSMTELFGSPKGQAKNEAGAPPTDAVNPWAASQGDPNFSLGDVGSMAKGAVKTVVGGPGDIERFAIDKLGMGDEGNILPTSEGVGEFLGFDPPADKREAGYETLGSLLGGVGGTAATIGRKSLPGLLPFTATARATRLGKEVESGELGAQMLKRPRELSAARKDVADQTYGQAERAMNAAQAEIPWQEHPSGRAFLTDLTKALDTSSETTATAGTRDAVRGILRDLTGEAKAGGGTAYSNPTVLRETLRKLRDQSLGFPTHGYEAIDKIRAGSLADKLADSLAQWEPSLKRADDLYKQASAKLYPPRVRPGEFAKDFDSAEQAVNKLETDVRNKSVPTKKMVDEVRGLVKQDAVGRLIDTKTAGQLNERLNKIERAQAHGKTLKQALGAGGALLGYEKLFGK
jgi:hypothetical protein